MAIDANMTLDPSIAAIMNETGGSKVKGKSELEMNDFINIMVEQMKNQDMYNTADASEYVNQLSQYTMIEAITDIQTVLKDGLANMQELALSSYSMSMIGKEAVVAIDGGEAGVSKVSGMIEAVTYYDGEPKVVINGDQYSLTQVMSVTDKEIIEKAAAEEADRKAAEVEKAKAEAQAIEDAKAKAEAQAIDDAKAKAEAEAKAIEEAKAADEAKNSEGIALTETEEAQGTETKVQTGEEQSEAVPDGTTESSQNQQNVTAAETAQQAAEAGLVNGASEE